MRTAQPAVCAKLHKPNTTTGAVHLGHVILAQKHLEQSRKVDRGFVLAILGRTVLAQVGFALFAIDNAGDVYCGWGNVAKITFHG